MNKSYRCFRLMWPWSWKYTCEIHMKTIHVNSEEFYVKFSQFQMRRFLIVVWNTTWNVFVYINHAHYIKIIAKYRYISICVLKMFWYLKVLNRYLIPGDERPKKNCLIGSRFRCPPDSGALGDLAECRYSEAEDDCAWQC